MEKNYMNMQENGQAVQINPRTIQIYSISLEDYNKQEDEITFIVHCSKGTYIRSLCVDIAEKLNTIGCLKELERTRVGKFDVIDSIKIGELQKNKDNIKFINEHIINFETILKDKPVIILANDEINKYLNGVKLYKNIADGIYRVKDNKYKFIGTAEAKNGYIKRDIVL